MSAVATPTKRGSACPVSLAHTIRIALVGPDGVGKSTAIELVCERLKNELPGSQVELRRWRPGLLPDLGRFLGKPATHAKAVKPRREGGRFQWLRVLYYHADFAIGGWWKDRVKPPRGSVIIYDRCALDMKVDPVRFGLRSARGTGFLNRWSPKPHLVVLLDDSPERICLRKQELEPHEMAEQLAHWRRLAESGEVHAIVRVDAGPEEIAARVFQLIVTQAAGLPSSHANSVEWIRTILGESSPAKQFAVLPSASNPRFLVPLAPLPVAGKSLEILNPQRATGRAWRKLVSLGLASGFAQRLPLHLARVPVGEFEEFLAEATGCREVSVSISLGRGGIQRKPVFQVMRGDGSIIAYAKAGWNEATAETVRNEEAALRRMEKVALSTAVVPRVLHGGWFRDSYILVQEAAGDSPGESPRRLDHRHMRFLRELPEARETGSQVGYPAQAIRELGFDYYAYLLEYAAELGAPQVPYRLGHGDFAPWNIRMTGEKLLVLDWEYSCPVPPGWDLFHFLIGTAIELDRKSAAEIYRSLRSGPVRRRIEEYFDTLRLSRANIEPLLISWLAETLSHNLGLFEHQPTPEDLVSRRVWAGLLDLMLNARRSA